MFHYNLEQVAVAFTVEEFYWIRETARRVGRGIVLPSTPPCPGPTHEPYKYTGFSLQSFSKFREGYSNLSSSPRFSSSICMSVDIS